MRTVICQVVGWLLILSTFIIEYYEIIPQNVWNRLCVYVFSTRSYDLYLAPTTLAGLLLHFYSLLKQLKVRIRGCKPGFSR